MSFTTEIDFVKYGIDVNITPEMGRLPANIKSNVLPVKRNGNKITFQKKDKSTTTFTLANLLKAGTYGEGWLVNEKIDNTDVMVKILKTSEIAHSKLADYEYDIIQEAFIQILVYEASKDLKYPEINLEGPFAPRFFLFGKDDTNYYIVSERMDGDVQHFVDGVKTIPTAGFMKTSTTQIAKILTVLYDKIKYNHRDLKSDNIMYKMINGKINIRLIDFGFSCLSYKSLRLSALSDDIYAHMLHCDSNIRDMHQYLYNLYNFTYYHDKKSIKCPIRRIFEALITNDKYGLGPGEWVDTYLMYDDTNAMSNPQRAQNASCKVVYNIFSSLVLENEKDPCSEINKDWTKHLVYIYDSTYKYLDSENIKYLPIVPFYKHQDGYLTRNLDRIWTENRLENALITEFNYIIEGFSYPVPAEDLPTLFNRVINSETLFKIDKLGETLLHKIARNKSHPAADKFLDKVLDKMSNHSDLYSTVSKKNETALDIALANTYTYAVKRLLAYDSGRNNGKVKRLLETNTEFNSDGAKSQILCEALKNPKAGGILDIIIKTLGPKALTVICNNKESPMDIALKYNNTYAIYKLMSLDFKLDNKDFLFKVRQVKTSQVLDKLFEKYADFNTVNNTIENGLTSLHMATIHNNIVLIKKLLTIPDIIISKRDITGKTCLHYAAMTANGKQFLDTITNEPVKYGPDFKDTAFEIVKILLEKYPALADIKDNDNKSPDNQEYTTPAVHSYIKSKKSGFFKRNPDTEKNRRKGGTRKLYRRKTIRKVRNSKRQ